MSIKSERATAPLCGTDGSRYTGHMYGTGGVCFFCGHVTWFDKESGKWVE
ncbi:hypothetical protein CF_21 [Curtobacterium phage Ayka]|nr:hypothetical protein CF_21 [Curtobacterium phage Ayka]